MSAISICMSYQAGQLDIVPCFALSSVTFIVDSNKVLSKHHSLPPYATAKLSSENLQIGIIALRRKSSALQQKLYSAHDVVTVDMSCFCQHLLWQT